MKNWKLVRLLAMPAAAMAAAGSAMAEVPADVTTAIADLKADGIAVATAFLIAVIAVAAIKFLRSAK